MIVHQIMTRSPVTVLPETPVAEAQALMRKNHFHRLPVVNRQQKLVGIVSEKDLIYASPSPATTLNVYEIGALLSRLKVSEIMSSPVITATADSMVEDAARLLSDNDIGGLPVMDGDRLVGILTESDVFHCLIELFGTRQKGVRITAEVPEQTGELAQLSSALAQQGIGIISLGTWPGTDQTNRILTVKLEHADEGLIRTTLEPWVTRILDIREA